MDKKDQSSSEDEFLELSDGKIQIDLVFPKSDDENPEVVRQNFNRKRYQKKPFNRPKKFYRPKQSTKAFNKAPEIQPSLTIHNDPETVTANYPKDDQILKDSEKIPEPKKKQYKKKFIPKAEAKEFEPKLLSTNSLSSKANAKEFKPKTSSSHASLLKAQAEDFKPKEGKTQVFVPKSAAPEFKPQTAEGQNFIPNKDAAEFLPKH